MIIQLDLESDTENSKPDGFGLSLFANSDGSISIKISGSDRIVEVSGGELLQAVKLLTD